MRRWLVAALVMLTSLAGLTAVAVVDSAPAAAVAAADAGAYVSVPQARVADTRTGLAGNRRGAIPAQGAAVFQIGGKAQVPRGAAAVALTISAIAPGASGSFVAYRAGTPVPGVVTGFFTRGQTVSNSAVVRLASNGRITVLNRSAAGLHVIIDVVGYYRSGTPSTPGAFASLTPSRVLDTRTGAAHNRRGVLSARQTTLVQVAGRGGVPSGVSAVVATLAAVSPTGSGAIVAGPSAASLAGVANIAVSAGRNAADLVVLPLSGGGRLAIRNSTSGRVHLSLDVVGYYRGGFAAYPGHFAPAGPARVATVRIGARGTAALDLGGLGGVPQSNVSAVVGTLTAIKPAASGSAVMYRPGTPRPRATSLNFGRGRSASNLVAVQVSSDGQAYLQNAAPTAVTYAFDVAGYYLSSALAVSVGHYVRSVSSAPGKFADSSGTGVGCRDAKRGSTFVLLDIGAQLNDQTGVALSVVDTPVSYGQLVSAVNAYLSSYRKCSGRPLVVAVGTNNDADDWTTYPASQRGADWANKVVDAIAPPAGVSVYGAIDIEYGFFSTEPDAEQWELSFLANTGAPLVFNGSADGCPSTFEVTGAGCTGGTIGWTQANYYRMAHGIDPTRVLALPQIYNADQAIQWANIDATGDGTGSRGITFAGALTEYGTCGATCSFSPAAGWAALRDSLARLGLPLTPAVVDLDVLS